MTVKFVLTFKISVLFEFPCTSEDAIVKFIRMNFEILRMEKCVNYAFIVEI